MDMTHDVQRWKGIACQKETGVSGKGRSYKQQGQKVWEPSF